MVLLKIPMRGLPQSFLCRINKRGNKGFTMGLCWWIQKPGGESPGRVMTGPGLGAVAVVTEGGLVLVVVFVAPVVPGVVEVLL